MTLLKLIHIWVKRVQSFLLLGVTISLLFYYTFENEIDMLNSYAENEYMPPINGALTNHEINSQVDTAVKPVSDSAQGLPSSKPSAEVDVASTVPAAPVTPQAPVDHSPAEPIIIDLRDPKVLKEKNKYFPLLLSSPWRGSTKFQDRWINPEIDDLSSHKDRHAVLNEVSLPLNFQQVPKDYPNVQASSFEDGGHQQNQLLQQVRQLFVKSWDQEELSRPDLAAEPWPLSLIDSLDTLYIMGQMSKFDDAVHLISTVDFTIPPITENSVDIPDVSTRALGGLISAYELSEEPVLLAKAKDLANFILRAFDTPNRIPILQYFWKTEYGNRFPYQYMNVGSLTNVALEFTRLAQITHSNSYFDAIQKIFGTIALSLDEFAIEHMFPTTVDGSGCRILTPKEVSTGHHLRNPKVMKSIDQNLEFIHCHQTGKFLISPRDWEKKEQLFKMDYQHQSVYSNLVKIYHLLNGHDILTISKTYHPMDSGEEVENIGKNTADDMKDEEAEHPDSSEKLQMHSSKQLFSIAMRKIRHLMLYRPLSPVADHNLTLISSFRTKTRISPSTDELQVEIKRLFDMNHEGCSLATTLGLASGLFNNTEYLRLAKKLTHSYYEMIKLFGGIFPEELYLDPCEKETCLFDKNEKIQSILDGQYTNQDALTVGDAKVELDSLQTQKASGGMRKILMFGLTQGIGEFNYGVQDIDRKLGKWKHDPDRPFWVNKIGKRHLLSPNVIESIFYMYRITGESQWRKMGAELLKMTIENLQKYHSGAKGVWSVREFEDDEDSSIPSSWFSQTLKYYYLLFSDTSDYTLDRYLFTSGGHLMKRDPRNKSNLQQ
ncbi:ZYRO0F03168p [Zygosaccharomyces rouxii]|uniref:alpha-1,2-Mannosidase n=1 Tax=Zygosaccharomyces rouxii (strain ATCC 2623 / CBS 732 / NBRC 1130 / NCYC 568 / NRRL Y-229) TaxID=559307 RepID=C5DX91_ZYGRC|nr:uncharacterized protein ZYRO0F03168g [Zygosaccharomyces rouxii]KAH9199166.1 glycoside hydrolase [Zygosaccharomyces rouxii]CAR28402.1 ZYRO0F03168p [Zygosaccharomyces rouxii]